MDKHLDKQRVDKPFNVATDPGETHNLAYDPRHAHIVAELSARIERFFATLSKDSADMWRGGQPIQNAMMTAYWRAVLGEDWEPVYAYDEG